MKVVLLSILMVLAINADLASDLKSIEAQEFGKFVFDTLQLELQTGDPINRFNDIMKDLETSLEGEQKEADQKHKTDMDLCDRDIQDFNKDNNALQRRLVEIQAVLDRLNPSLAKSKEIHGQKTQFRSQLQAQLDELTVARNQEAQEYAQRVEENDYATYVIQTVRRMFAEQNDSFLQVSDAPEETVKKAAEHLFEASNQAKGFKVRKAYSNVFKLMAQMTNKMAVQGNSPLVGKIINLCDTLLKTIDDNRLTEKKAETIRIENYNSLKKILEYDINNLSTHIAKLDAEIVQTQDKITVAQRDQTETKERQVSKAKQIVDRDTECKENTFAYNEDRKKRDSNRSIVSQIIGVATVNQRDFRNYISARKQAGDFEGETFKVLNP